MLSADQRLRMVEAATEAEPRFTVDAREIRRSGYSYTIDTLTELRNEFPETPFGLILGMDAFLDLPTWHRWNAIVSIAHLIVARRPGWHLPERNLVADLVDELSTDDPKDLEGTAGGRIYIASVTQLEISSTGLRDSIAAGLDPMYLVPPSVRAIIMETESYAKQKKHVGLDAE